MFLIKNQFFVEEPVIEKTVEVEPVVEESAPAVLEIEELKNEKDSSSAAIVAEVLPPEQKVSDDNVNQREAIKFQLLLIQILLEY